MATPRIIDFRSDTVTRPDDGMRHAMASAEVGDDVFGEDPTVRRLEARVAEMFGKEAALFTPSGTMANQIIFKTIARPTWELLCERECHVANYEVAGPAALSGLLVNLLPSERGYLSAAQVRENIRAVNEHHPLTKIVALENTHNRHGGTVCPLGVMQEIGAVCRESDLHLHLDGARIWNAHIASGVSLADFASPVDTLAVCLSKGLGAPLGSLTVGTKDFIKDARRIRKLFGGGMRQIGIIAAAGLYALDNNIAKLAQDHENATALAQGLATLPGLSIDLSRVETNIILVDLVSPGLTPAAFAERTASVGVLSIPFGPRRVRFMTHLDVSSADCAEAVRRLRPIF